MAYQTWIIKSISFYIICTNMDMVAESVTMISKGYWWMKPPKFWNYGRRMMFCGTYDEYRHLHTRPICKNCHRLLNAYNKFIEAVWRIYHHWFRWWLVAWPAPSHYLNQCWNIVNWTLGNKFQWNLNRTLYIFIQENAFENVVRNLAAILSRPKCVKTVKTPFMSAYVCFCCGTNFNPRLDRLCFRELVPCLMS